MEFFYGKVPDGLIGNIIVGIVGGFIGGFLAGKLGIAEGVWQIIIAAFGAWILLFMVNLLKKN